MKLSDLEQFRNSNGYIDLDKIPNKVTQQNIIGRKPKAWILLDDTRILFKETNAYSYEDYSQLFFAEFLEQCGLEHADYDLAIFNGRKGVLSPDFSKEGEILISGKTLLDSLKTTYTENNIDKIVCNSVESIVDVLRLINIDEAIINTIRDNMIRTLIFDGTLLETDRNNTNWSIITSPFNFEFTKNPKNGILVPLNTQMTKVRMAPLSDGSNIFGLNRNVSDIQTKIKNIRDEGTIYSIIGNSKRALFTSSETMDQSFTQELQFVCDEYPHIIRDFIPKILSLSVDKANEKVEAKTKTETPFEILIWMDKILKYSKENVAFGCRSILDEDEKGAGYK
jgi:hypothetical protein